MVQFHRRRFLETENLTALGIHARHDVLDRAVLAGRVHRLQDHEDGVTAIGIEKLLGIRQLFQVLFQNVLGPFLHGLLSKFFELLRLSPSGVVILQANPLATRNAKCVHDFFLEHVSSRIRQEQQGVRGQDSGVRS